MARTTLNLLDNGEEDCQFGLPGGQMQEDGDDELDYDRSVVDRTGMAISTMFLHFHTLQGYGPGRLLCEYFLPGHARRLEHLGFDVRYENGIPSEFGEKIDSILIDWLEGDVSPDITGVRLDAVVSDLGDFAFDKPSTTQELVDLCVGHLTKIIDEILPLKRERVEALRFAKMLRTALSVPEPPANSRAR